MSEARVPATREARRDMSVRRSAAQLATVLLLTTGTAMLAAIPARAQDAEQQARVQLSLPSKFTAGEKAGGVTVKVTKRSEECVSLRTTLAIRLPGAGVDQVAVQARIDDDWVRVPVADDGGGLLITDRTAPEDDELCKGKSRSVRYQVAFAAGAPAGTANIVAEAYAASGELLGREVGGKKVGGRQAGTYEPAPPSPTEEPSPEPTPEPTEEAPVAEQSAVPAAAPPDPDLLATAGQGGGGGLGISTGVLTVGLGMVAGGAALLVLLIRRGRGDKHDSGGDGGAPGAGGATMLLPRIRR
ncbi:hypothetical protein [Micromonospora sp. LOL_023]|uniref:hypothetical protein n=1 Tax=Micromonospora sp. LOL_023 TaxID=3345418 RepID=UPI003A89F977